MEGQIIALKRSRLINGSIHDEIQLRENNPAGIYIVTAMVSNNIFKQAVELK